MITLERTRERETERDTSTTQSTRRERQEISRPTQRDASQSCGKELLTIKTRGIMFGKLESIPTDLVLDPSTKVYYNCWQGSHPLRNALA